MEYVGSDNDDDVNERNTTCPFSCFGSDDDNDDDDDNVCVLSSVETEARNTAKSRQLCNTSNSNRPISLGPIIDNSLFIIFDTSTTVGSSGFSSTSSGGLGLRATKAYKMGQEILR
jgi:hypothetical protein